MNLEESEAILERYELSIERISLLAREETVKEPFCTYFRSMADFVLKMKDLYEKIQSGATERFTLEEWQNLNQGLYEDILPENYEKSYANPVYAVETLGDTHGRILSFLYTELRGMIAFVFEKRLYDITILNELLIEIYNSFEEEIPSYRVIQQIIYWFISDYSDHTVACRVREALDPTLDFAVNIIMEEDLRDLRFLYKYGEYITDNELLTARYLNSLSEDQIELLADTYTNGYRIGFEKAGIDMSKKKTVNIRYNVGFERIIRQAVKNFERMGLSPVIYRAAVHSINKRGQSRIGYLGAIPNKQYDYDHRADQAIYLDKPFVERKLGVLRTSYEDMKQLADVHGGPALVEVFGEKPFIPVNHEEAYRLSDKQQKLSVLYDNESSQIMNQYMKGDERSFTIVAFPMPEIGEKFEEIFQETIKINTLDYKLYQKIQQTMIDTLDQGTSVHIQGKGDNHTDLTVQLHPLNNPEKETVFENCVADVNIPVGEVFTSPRLTGTNGVLHVSEVYLNELCYKQLSITFRDGKITDYICSNFDSEEENKRYILENILHHHETLPMGEFAIGTNTTAYMMARKYKIGQKLPILIAEKTGPHFAVGDTCFCWSEDNYTCNTNGKEMIAKDNEISILRKEDVSRAYFGCHTDITIPYNELGCIAAVDAMGNRTDIIRDGRFVLKGTEELNAPFLEQ